MSTIRLRKLCPPTKKLRVRGLRWYSFRVSGVAKDVPGEVLSRGYMKLRSIVLVLLGCSGDSKGPQGQPPVDPPGTGEAPLKLEVVASGLSNPVHLTAPAGDARLFIVEKTGRIRIVQ